MGYLTSVGHDRSLDGGPHAPQAHAAPAAGRDVRINGTPLNAPCFALWTDLRSRLPNAVPAGIRSIEFVLKPTWKNATYCVWSSKSPAQYDRVPIKQLYRYVGDLAERNFGAQ